VDWFNNRRLLEPIGNIPPAEAEELFYAKVKEMPIGGVTQTKQPPDKPGTVHCCDNSARKANECGIQTKAARRVQTSYPAGRSFGLLPDLDAAGGSTTPPTPSISRAPTVQ
jgi:hypothetical protein